MKVLALDISTSAGWALLEGEEGDEKPSLVEYGTVKNDGPVESFGPYPFSYIWASRSISDRLYELVEAYEPDVVVIEELNLGKSRYAQKALEQIHCQLLLELENESVVPHHHVVYLTSSSWRQALDMRMTKEDRKNNAQLAKAKRQVTEGLSLHEAKKNLGIKGKIDKKHLAVRLVNETYDTKFKMKDNDICDAIALGMAFLRGATRVDGSQA